MTALLNTALLSFLLLNVFFFQTDGCGLSNYFQDGDLILGGLIPLHTFNETSQDCSTLRSLDSLKRVEAFAFAIKRINENPTLLPNITLGFDIHDTCSYDSRTLRASLNFLPISEDTCGPITDACFNKSDGTAPVVGIVGAQRSASSIQAATLLGQYHIPMVSYLSTSDELSNNVRYPYFLRTVGPDSYQVRAILDILDRFQWTYLAFVNSDDTYGRSAANEFASLAGDRGICVGFSRVISQSYLDDDYERLIADLVDFQNGSHATVVILFAHLGNSQKTFSAATRLGATRRFTWIGSDGWGNYGEDGTSGMDEAALGAFTIVPESKPLADFITYFQYLTPENSSNPWLSKFIQQYRDPSCKPVGGDSNPPECDDRRGIFGKLNTVTSSHETLVMDSVFAFAHALDNMRTDLCPDTMSGLCPEMRPVNRRMLLDYLLKTSFTSLANGGVTFMPNGDVSGKYSIRYLNLTDDGYRFVEVGRWHSGMALDSVFDQNITWYIPNVHDDDYTASSSSAEPPISVCSKECKKGEITQSFDHLCCWTCTSCDDHEYVLNNEIGKSCIDHETHIFGWPNENRTSCGPIPPSNNLWTEPIITFASLGLLFTCMIVCMYVYNRENRLIKASSREISYLMFIGIFLAYLSAILLVLHPTTGICALLRICPPIANSLIYVSLVIKTTRLFRIFRASVKSAKRPRFIKPNSQIALILLLTAIPVTWSIIWIIITLPKVVGAMPRDYEYYLEITCTHSDAWLYGLMVWNMCVVLACSILAALTRKLPENYNESRFITFCAFCSLVVFLAFQSTVLVISHENAYSINGYEALGLIVNATVVLFSLFVVKLYAAYFVAIEKWNVRRRSSMPSGSLSSSTPNQNRHSKGIVNGSYVPDVQGSGEYNGSHVSRNGNVRSDVRSGDFSPAQIGDDSVFYPATPKNSLGPKSKKADISNGLDREYHSMVEQSPSDGAILDDREEKCKSLTLTPKEAQVTDDVNERHPERLYKSLKKLNGVRVDPSNKRSFVDYNRSSSNLSIHSIHDLPEEVQVSNAESV